MQTIRGTVEKIFFTNERNGYTVFLFAPDGKDKKTTAVGIYPDIKEDDRLSLMGDWEEHPKYGRQFHAEAVEEALPETVQGIQDYLSKNMIKGISTKHAAAIAEKFGKDTFQIMDNEPERLLEVRGIGEKTLEKIKEDWKEKRAASLTVSYFLGLGLGASLAMRIYKTYEQKSIEKVKENPYRLIDDVVGVGFITADRIAAKVGIKKNNPKRIRAGVLYALKQSASEGNCYEWKGMLIQRARDVLNGQDEKESVLWEEVLGCIDEMIKDKSLAEESNAVYLLEYYRQERFCAKEFKRKAMQRAGSAAPVVPAGRYAIYNEDQMEAINTALSSRIMILTGGPGTGKTTTILGIVSALQSRGKTVLLAAPTGRAARRMSEAAKMPASTIHRLLHCDASGIFQEDYTISGDALIVDESSMIDISLMYHLLMAVPDHMSLVFVGDVDQLPSIGPGNILNDLIASGLVPTVRLTKIYRQAKDSLIVQNARRINLGEDILEEEDEKSDFCFIEADNDDRVQDIIVELCAGFGPKELPSGPMTDIQVLTPMKKTGCGTIALNRALQRALNPDGEPVPGGYRDPFCIGDRVMQIRNNYTKGVFNGDVGFISGFDDEEKTVIVDFEGKDVAYEICEMNELMLAYACTIHKSQGSEYGVVIMALSMSHQRMLERRLLYTGVTRAKGLLILVGDRKAVETAIQNNRTTRRNTKLVELMTGPSVSREEKRACG